MVPVTLATAQKMLGYLLDGEAFASTLAGLSVGVTPAVDPIPDGQVYLSSASIALADLQDELGFPRIAVSSTKLVNSQREKFRTLSGSVTVAISIAATADILTNVDAAMHYYVEAVTEILRQNRGDWGDGVYYSGAYEVDIQAPRMGGSGFVQTATVSLDVFVSQN